MTAGAARGGLGFSYAKAGAIYGLYTGMVYLLSLPGGWVADRITRPAPGRALRVASSIAAGQFCLVAPSIMTFYLGLVLLGDGHRTAETQRELPSWANSRGRATGDATPPLHLYMGINLGAPHLPVRLRLGGRKGRLAIGFRPGGRGHDFVGLYSISWEKYLGVAAFTPPLFPTTRRLIAGRSAA